MTIQTTDIVQKKALATLTNGQTLLNKYYLADLGNYPLQLLAEFPNEKINPSIDVRIFKIERIVLGNKQSALESLTAAYTALGSIGYSIFLFLKSENNETHIYLGTKGQPKKAQGNDAEKLLSQVFNGHFSGSKLVNINGIKVESLLYNIRDTTLKISPIVTAVTGVPSLSVEEREHFMQGLEHFIDATEGQNYQALILAEPVSQQQLNTIQRGYEDVATQLSPLVKQTLSYGENDSESIGYSITENLSTSLSHSLSQTETTGQNESNSNTTSRGTNTSYTESNSTTLSSSTTHSSSTSTSKDHSISGPLKILQNITVSLSKTKSKTEGMSNTEGISKTRGFSHTKGTSFSTSQGHTTGTSYSSGKTQGISESNTQGTSNTDSINTTSGSNRQITLETIDKNIENLLKKIDCQLDRINEARRYGAWNTAAYFIGESTASSRALASTFLGLMQGANTHSETIALTTWNSSNSKQVLPWLSNLSHPRLGAPFAQHLGINYLTPATLVSGKEMAIQLSLPRSSVSTVSVVEAQTFGRQVQTTNNTQENINAIELGCLRHLWKDLENKKINLDLNKLTSHLFVSGSTGSGKSNTIYQLLDQVSQSSIPFMVIEPAKGEYKNIFGHRDDVLVLGTNPKLTQILKINPFRFPEEIHVLEHIDRLVEIFNVCWPMYAAMPAVLKEAMLETYRASGWDLDISENHYSNDIFPSFQDLLEKLKLVIEQSDFSQEIKSNYIGSLITRVKSLTNGLNGQIFSNNEIDNNLLFDSSVIVDLSRVGSQETKALIMGILIMRLSEHRMSFNTMNQSLKHITVLEEAHNILKRTSTEQSSESSNVAGKAVEMLSNAIAEMRTYGEGFIIADQSPSAVDISAIRNTNTKIVMRLPDEADRRLIGKASGVSDEQVEEIAKLPKGVAVIYQNDWLEPVLCKINHFICEEKPYQYKKIIQKVDRKKFNSHLVNLFLGSQIENVDLDILKQGIKEFNFFVYQRIYIQQAIDIFEKTQKLPISDNQEHLFVRLINIIGIENDIFKKSEVTPEYNELIDFTHKKLSDHLDDIPDYLESVIKQYLPKLQ